MRDDRFIYKVVEMYYRKGMSQLQIGKKLNVSRTTVFRALEKAKKEGYVQVVINRPQGLLISKEEALEKKFHLQEAIIVYKDVKDSLSVREEIAYYVSDFLLRTLHNDMSIAISRGKTLQQSIAFLEKDMRLKFQKYQNVKLLPLMGSINYNPSDDYEYRFSYSNYLIERLASILNCDGYQLLAPLVVSSPEVKDILVKEKPLKEVFEMDKSADLAFTGIGTVKSDSITMEDPMLDEKTKKEIASKNGVGEIIGHILDENGHFIDTEYHNKLMALSPEDFKQISVRVGAAGGMEKKDAILSVLKGEWINVLITDEEVANYLLEV
jgi:DNA-binding transcriptional regulator LsrR (DeoR family)